MSEENTNIQALSARAASSINPAPPPEDIELDQVMKLLNKYFEQGAYECAKHYKDGLNVELLRDKLDTTTLLTCIMRIVFDHEKSIDGITDSRKIELSLVYQAIEKLLQILRTDQKSVACVDVLCKIIGYSMKNYKTYNN